MKLSVYLTIVSSVLLTGCQAPQSAEAGARPAALTGWPETLYVFGDGYPNAGDPCRRVGETDATRNYLDHSETLVGCRTKKDAERLNGVIVGEERGVILVSVPDGG